MSTAAEDMREYLEAAIRRRWPAGDPRPVAEVNEAIEEILRLADMYRAMSRPGRPPSIDPVCAAARDRRARIQAAAVYQAAVHWQKPRAAPNAAACHGKVTRAPVTSLRSGVTCGACMEAPAWHLDALGEAA